MKRRTTLRLGAPLLVAVSLTFGCRSAASAPIEVPECRVDADCFDVSACNGEERCASGVCESGEPRGCPAEMICRDRDQQASCEFLPKSPWLLYSDNPSPKFFGLHGLPSALLGKIEPFDLSPRAPAEEYLAVNDFHWSPDGNYVLVDMMRHDYTGRLFWIAFGRGMPSATQSVKNLPSTAVLEVLQWSRDSRRALLFETESKQMYELDFSSGEPRPAWLEGLSAAGYCGDAVVFQRGSDDVYLAYDFTETEPEVIGKHDATHTHNFTLSPDGNRVSLGLETKAWSDCTVEGPHSLLADDAVEWSPDGRYAALDSSDRLWVASTEDGSELWSTAKESSFLGFWWSSESRLLVENEFGTDETVWQSVELPSGTVSTGTRPRGAVNARALGPNLLFQREEADGQVLFARPNSVPELLGGCASPDAVDLSRDARSLVCTGWDEFSGSRVIAFDLDLDAPLVGRDLLDEPSSSGHRLWGFSPDGRGVLVERRAEAEKNFIDGLWFPAVPHPAGPPIKINQGEFADFFYEPWQPFP